MKTKPILFSVPSVLAALLLAAPASGFSKDKGGYYPAYSKAAYRQQVAVARYNTKTVAAANKYAYNQYRAGNKYAYNSYVAANKYAYRPAYSSNRYTHQGYGGNSYVVAKNYGSRSYYNNNHGYRPHYGNGYGYRPYYGGYYSGYAPYWGGYYGGPAVSFSYTSTSPAYSDSNYYGSDDLAADVQAALRRRGFYGGPIDGDVGRGTRAAIRAYQSNRGLAVTGRIDRSLVRSLGVS